MLSSQQNQNTTFFKNNNKQKISSSQQTQHKLCPFCHKTYSLMKIFNYNSPTKSKYKRYYHDHSDGCISPKASNYCFDSNGIPGKKYCCKTCLTHDSVDPKMEQETVLIMDLIESVQRKLDAVNNNIFKTMNYDKALLLGGENDDHVRETLNEIRRVFQKLSSQHREIKDIRRHAIYFAN